MSTEDRDIKFIKGIGEKRAQLFKKRLGLFSLRDLLKYYPRTYEDWSKTVRISDITFKENVCIKAKIASEIEKKVSYNKKTTTYTFYIYDRTGQIKVVLFNNKYLAESLKKNEEYLFYGKVKWNGIFKEMDSPEIRDVSKAVIRPIYKATEGLSSRQIEKIMPNALLLLSDEDFLPKKITQKYNLFSHYTAINQIHFPDNPETLKKAKIRLAFEELFLLRTGFLHLRSRNRGNTAKAITLPDINVLLNIFPFSLTNAQIKVIDECLKDLSKTTPMNRLIQGDVGSGKTAVAAALCYAVKLNGYSSALLAPTEILANQHYETFCKLFKNLNLNIALLTGALSAKEKAKIKEDLKKGKIDILVATHAVLTEDVVLNRTALVITDEQHRFGVSQRAELSRKANSPHTLVMSATPIPRTMGLVVYGDLDISIIDELPKGRIPIESYCVNSKLRKRALEYVKKHLNMGYQGYIVCPAIDEDDDSDLNLAAATEYAEMLQKDYLKEFKIGLLHGKMKPKEKEKIMHLFCENKINLLVSTTVIEVGVDVPNAVIMIVENAERFGLSQLHQLRGRVGRGNIKSTCIFITSSNSEQTKARLKALCSTTDGFKIAEEDLKLRGPGNFLGKEQHGLPNLKTANLLNDYSIMQNSTEAANYIYKTDPTFLNYENHLIKNELEYIFSGDTKIEFN